MVRIEEDNIVFWTPSATFFFKGVFSRIIFKAFSVNRAFRIDCIAFWQDKWKILKYHHKSKFELQVTKVLLEVTRRVQEAAGPA